MTSLIGRASRISCILLALALALPAFAAPYAAFVMDARTGETLYEKNADSRLHPASLTKMMTLYIVFEEISAGRISLDSKVTVSKNAAAQAPSRLGLKPGQKIALRYLIRAAAVKSANDAATALGEYVGGGSQAAFSKRMNRTAKALGMRNSTFKNPNGLTAEGHLSTARDMSILGRRLFYDFPQFYNIFSRRTADAGMAEVRNTNTRFLDAYKGADGIKTGYTNAAGFNLTASAERGNKRIIATVFGGSSTANRNAKVSELLDIGFGAAPGNVREKKPEAPAYSAADEQLIADADTAAIDAALAEAANGIDVADAAGGSAKTIRVSGEVRKSLRPKPRPAALGAPVVAAADPVADAIAAGVEDMLAEVIGSAAPLTPLQDGTLDAQAASLADPAATPAPGTLDAQALALAPGDAAPSAAAPAPGTLDAQAAALADPTLADASLAAPAVPDPTLADARPKRRPAQADAAPEVAALPEPAAPELVVTDAGETGMGQADLTQITTAEPAVPAAELDVAADQPLPVAPDVATDMSADLAGVTAVETVAGATNAAPAPIALAAAMIPAKRKAPIFESTEVVPAPPTPDEPEVVVRASTSGGRGYGVTVGSFTSRSEAERAMLKTALAESATLNGGLRKVVEKGGKYRASFMGLSEDEAELACRRLRARAVECETIG